MKTNGEAPFMASALDGGSEIVILLSEEREKWVVVRDTTAGREHNLSSVLKVPRHSPFVLLVSVSI
jgi:hypothetical protein